MTMLPRSMYQIDARPAFTLRVVIQALVSLVARKKAERLRIIVAHEMLAKRASLSESDLRDLSMSVEDVLGASSCGADLPFFMQKRVRSSF